MNLSDLPVSIANRIRVDGDCWLWQGSFDRGVPSAHLRALGCTHNSVRRYVREKSDGVAVRRGRVVTFKCGEHRCISPACSVIKTRGAMVKSIVRDARWRARVRVAKQAGGTLTMAVARDIRVRYAAGGESQHALASEFGVTQMIVWRIVNGLAWREASPLALLAQQAGMLP